MKYQIEKNFDILTEVNTQLDKNLFSDMSEDVFEGHRGRVKSMKYRRVAGKAEGVLYWQLNTKIENVLMRVYR